VEVSELSLVDDVKDELARVDGESTSARRAQAAAMIRFGGGLHLIRRHIVVECHFSNLTAAQWLAHTIKTVYGHDSEVVKVSRQTPSGNQVSYSLRVIQQGGALALQSGLLDRRRRPVRGLAPEIVMGGTSELCAAWRGAFLASGDLSDPGKASHMEVTCPGQEAAIALIGMARRLGITVKAQQTHGSARLVIRDSTLIEKFLSMLGAAASAHEWSGKRLDGETRGQVNRLQNFDDANMRRSAKAAVEAGAKVAHAFEVLGDDIPDNLRAAGQLRLDHKDASLDELGKFADPILTKDAIAGRIRRLLQLAAKVEAKRSAH
jgi:DNA-binding protein WhiA